MPSCPRNRPRVFDRGADIKILRLRVVGRNEIKTGRIFVVKAGWIHEAAGAGRLECFGQLPNLEAAKVIGHRHELMFFQETDHLLLAAFVSLQERRLIWWNVLAPRRVRIGQRRIGQKRFERAITRQLRAAQHLHLLRIQREQEDVLEVVIVIRRPHRRESHHRRQALFQAVRETMDRAERGIARFHQIFALVRRKIARQRHEAVVEEWIDGARGGNRELREKFDRFLQIALALGEHRRHLPETRRRGERAFARRVVFLFQQ